MSWIDWAIVIVPLIVIAIVAFRTQKHVTSVAEFMAGGRLGGRYLVCNAKGEMSMGVVSMVALYELLYQAGFTITWWQKMTVPLGLFIALTGYVYYRYRETRAMTLAQFFEIRYSKSFRLFAGCLGFLAGLINYGIFPAVSARFFVYFCGLPPETHFWGITIPTFAIIMLIYLTLALIMTLTGGQLTVMIVDCIEGLIALIMFIVIIVALLIMFDWSQIQLAMSQAPSGKSMLNPFDIAKAKDFNIWFVLIGVFGSLYGVMAWQGGHAFNSCAKNPHEAKMGAILGSWRNVSKGLMITLLAVCAITFLKHPDFAAQASQVQDVLNKISDTQIQNQMRMPIAINYMLPIAIKGMLCSIMLFGLLACDSSYLHSWGSIFIQDIILPLRKQPFTPRQHINLLRTAILGVAIFGFSFSLLFRQTEYILMFFALTGAIFLGGAGSVIAGGLYWKKGTTAGAWAAMISGSTLAVGGIILQQYWKTIQPWLSQLLPDIQIIVNNTDKFPVNGQVMYFWAMITSLVLYFIVSLLTCKNDFNMDRMLHRGKYSVAEDNVKVEFEKRWRWSSIIGIDKDFTKGDKAISGSVFAWTMFWWVVFIIVTAWNLINPWPLEWWGTYWHYYAIIIPLIVAFISTIWFLCGGIHDLHKLYTDLKTYKSNKMDDGTVILAEEHSTQNNYVDLVESENNTQDKVKPYPGKTSVMD